MKKIFALISVVFIVSSSFAQYADIPDSNFRNKLRELYPSCFNTAGLLDTTCSEIINEDSIAFVENPGIRNLDGIQYFKNLVTLNCSYVWFLDTIPSLPVSLKNFYCKSVALRTLPSLPQGLLKLSCWNNYQLTTLPVLPSSLIHLESWEGALTSLPILPEGLQFLYCASNNLTSLPAIPNSLLDLDFGYNKIPSFPVLPNTLKHLECNNNPLHTIPAFPASLEFLDCSADSLTVLPEFTDNGQWIYLACNSNQLTSLPTLPQLVTELVDCSNNRLTSLPRLTPTRRFDCRYNQISYIGDFYGPSFLYCSYNQLTSLPDLRVVEFLDISYNNITCLPKISPYFPWMDVSVIIDSSIKCNPNYDEHVIMNINLPHCNPTNNVNQCQPFPVIMGAIFYDNNNNNVRDAGEPYKRNAEVHLSTGLVVHSSNGGNYQIGPDSIGTYTVTVTPPPYFNVTPASALYTFTNYDTVVTKDFALQAAATVDSLTVRIIPINSAARPGFSFSYMISYENSGTTTLSPNIVFDYDQTRLNYSTSSVSGVVDNSNTLTYNTGVLVPGQSGSFIGYFTLNTTVPLGDTLNARADISANSFAGNDLVQNIVRGSFDPNDKQATPQLSPSQVASGKYIDYTIRFQNTGTDTAFNIVISDMLNGNLQAGTLQMLVSSHDCKATVKDNTVFFEFINILLPDSNVNEPMSHGFVSFRIKPQPTVAVNSTIPNKAAIYFDYNSPVITNTAGTLIKDFITVPLKLISFSAVPQNDNTTTLYWNTVNEINSKHFIIERGSDGLHFSSIASVAAKGMASNNYSANVADNNNGIVFYRLKMVDNDGKFSYSPIIKIDRRKNAAGFSVLTNPVKDILIINTTDRLLNNTSANIINTEGAVVKSFVIKEGSQTVEVKGLPDGIYYLKTMNGSIRILIR